MTICTVKLLLFVSESGEEHSAATRSLSDVLQSCITSLLFFEPEMCREL